MLAYPAYKRVTAAGDCRGYIANTSLSFFTLAFLKSSRLQLIKIRSNRAH